MNTSLLQIIFSFLFGHKYYTPILAYKGTFSTFMHGGIFHSKEEIEDALLGNEAYTLVEIVSFRSHLLYSNNEILNPKRS